MKACRYCAEEIQDAAIVCKHCGRDVAAAVATPVSVPPIPTPTKSRVGCGGWILVAVLLFVMLIFVGWCASAISPPQQPSSSTQPSATPATAPPARTAPTATWTTVATWTGSGMKETESFVTTGREWRVEWTTRNEAFAGAGIFQIFAHRTDDGAMVSLMANKQGVGRDVSYVRTPPGRHHLMINSGNVDWTVTVQEQR